MRKSNLILAAALVLTAFAAPSCQFLADIFHDDDVVARVGEHKLYRSEVLAVLPGGISSEDSTNLSLQYINSWAADYVYMDIAEKQLSKREKNVTDELEDYRRALLKYRYEQLYIRERLDTEVSDEEIKAYYDKSVPVLQVPVVKARFLRMSADSPNLDEMKKLISSKDTLDLVLADSLAYTMADKYTDYGGKWVDMLTLSHDFGTDYGSLLSQKNGSWIEVSDDYGKVDIAYIVDFARAGTPAPLEYSADEIREMIIGSRKNALVSTLEQSLLQDAAESKRFVIYE
ncbi:MAG: hypothetical protein MJY56_03320 [Bacteroidales bacterium]|nr:hypothetical protein [Bacteroidales bacterium]